MTFDWIELLELANELANRGDDEADLRSSMSRAYYASYCSARNFLRDKDSDYYLKSHQLFKSLETGYHTYVINTFLNHDDRLRTEIGGDLERLFDSRKKADYEDLIHYKKENIKKMAIFSLKLSENIRQKLNSL